MELEENATGRDRLARMLAAAGLTVAAAALLRRGRRITGVLAGAAALAFGYKAATESAGSIDPLGSDTSDTGAGSAGSGGHTGGIHCAICGEPIVPGQARGPDENDDIVHVECREATIEVDD